MIIERKIKNNSISGSTGPDVIPRIQKNMLKSLASSSILAYGNKPPNSPSTLKIIISLVQESKFAESAHN